MKKKLAGMLAVLMVLTMGTTVFANPSPDKDSDLKKTAEALKTTVESGSDSVKLSASAVKTDDLTEVHDVVSEKIGDVGFQVLAAVELATTDKLPTGGLRITIHVSGITSGTSNVRIYHKTASGWEVKTPYVGNGYVTATFDSLSPFFVVKYDSTPASTEGTTDSASVVNNYYDITYNKDSNNSSTTNNTNSNNTTTTNNTNSNNITNSDSNNTSDSNNRTTTNNKAASSKKKTDSSSTNGSSSAEQKSSSSESSGVAAQSGSARNSADDANAAASTDTVSGKPAGTENRNDNNSSNNDSSNNNSSSKNNQSVTVNVTGGGNSDGSAKAGASTSTTSPKTGSSMPALPMIAVFAVMGIAVCGKKARSL